MSSEDYIDKAVIYKYFLVYAMELREKSIFLCLNFHLAEVHCEWR